MIDLGLSRQEHRWLDQTLAGSYMLRVRVFLCNLDGDHITNLSWRLLGGAVNVDANAEVSRTATVELLDPHRGMAIVPDSPADGGVFLDNMIEIVHEVWVPQMDEWVQIPTFKGPIVSISPADEIITLECDGKERLALGQAWRASIYKKGHRRVNVIKAILTRYAGEDQFTMPTLAGKRLPRDMRVARQQVPWKVCKKTARGLDHQLFYNGRGRAVLRTPPSKPVFTFRDGPGGTVMTPPQVTYALGEVTNAVYVVGGFPRQPVDKATDKTDTEKESANANEPKPKRITAEAVAPRDHPLSPANLGPGDSERYLVETVEDDSLRSKAEALEVALRRLRRLLTRHIEVAFDARPVWYLEERDMVRVHTSQFAAPFVLDTFSLPLLANENMSVGYRRRMKRRKTLRERKLHRRNNRAAAQRAHDREVRKQKREEQQKQKAGKD